jgi:antitoxin component YwqK of YwqJK toxin-antitoxin module
MSFSVEQKRMKKPIIILGCLILSLFSCKPKLINQKTNKKREGLWIEQYSLDSAHYKSIGKYKNDDPIKKWCYYLDGKIIKKEKHKGNTCYTKFYHENGKIQSRGKTVLDTTTKYAHWFYSGNWEFYDNKGKLIIERNYQSGKLASETFLK